METIDGTLNSPNDYSAATLCPYVFCFLLISKRWPIIQLISEFDNTVALYLLTKNSKCLHKLYDFCCRFAGLLEFPKSSPFVVESFQGRLQHHCCNYLACYCCCHCVACCFHCIVCCCSCHCIVWNVVVTLIVWNQRRKTR